MSNGIDDSSQTIITQAVAALVRHGLTFAAGYLVTWGILDPSQTTNFTAIGVGAVVFLVGYLWSLAAKRAAAAKVEKLQTKLMLSQGQVLAQATGGKR